MRELILIGTSLSRESDAVVEVGLGLARAAGCPAHLIHVLQPLVPLGSPDAGWVMATTWEEELRTKLGGLLYAQGERCGLHDVAGSRSEIHDGNPERTLAELARAASAGLIVLGARVKERGRGLATTADRLLRIAETPVLVVRPEAPFPPRRVLYAVDLSAVSAGALRVGARWVGAAGGQVQSEIVFALDPAETVGWGAFTPHQVEEFADRELQRLAVRYGGRANARVVAGPPLAAMRAEIEAFRPDLIVLGTHGRRGWQRLLLGSFAQAILDESPCHVLVVPPESAHRALEERDSSADWRHVEDADERTATAPDPHYAEFL